MEGHCGAKDLGNLLRRKTKQPKSAFDHSWKETRMFTGTQRLVKARGSQQAPTGVESKGSDQGWEFGGWSEKQTFQQDSFLHQEGGALLEGSQLGV